MNQAFLPLVCPECESTNVSEVSDGIFVEEAYHWDALKDKYVFYSSDEENFGEVYIKCTDCNYHYSREEYNMFMGNGPITSSL